MLTTEAMVAEKVGGEALLRNWRCDDGSLHDEDRRAVAPRKGQARRPVREDARRSASLLRAGAQKEADELRGSICRSAPPLRAAASRGHGRRSGPQGRAGEGLGRVPIRDRVEAMTSTDQIGIEGKHFQRW